MVVPVDVLRVLVSGGVEAGQAANRVLARTLALSLAAPQVWKQGQCSDSDKACVAVRAAFNLGVS